ncbi:MAG TPA: SRPBCC domain-containing protein [Pseudonocardia sp.]|nr:SRPBCC domain-containing protein [Pseudonocardia sp.]
MSSRVLVALRIAAPPTRVFEAFTAEIGQWWLPNPLFRLTDRGDGRLAIEPHPGGRVLETYADGDEFEIGRVRVWQPPERLVLSWRAASFPPDRETEVHVRFEPVDEGTRVVVEHIGWDGIPQEHAARHGFPLFAFQQRLAEWWQTLLGSLAARTGD